MNRLNHMSQTQLVTHTLILALTAPSDAYSADCSSMADRFAVGLTDEQLDACKSAALQMAERSIGGDK
jgi:hypothetical protein